MMRSLDREVGKGCAEGLFSLERRRLRGDLIEVYKIMRGMDRMDSQKLFHRVEESVTRGHRFKVREALV